MCSCDSFLMTEESNTRASISRIVMLAEALFEVLTSLDFHAFFPFCSTYVVMLLDIFQGISLVKESLNETVR